MSIPGTLIPLFNSGGGASYSISRSLRFNSADSAHLSRTPASAGNRRTWTWAGWVKRNAISSAIGQNIFVGSDNPTKNNTTHSAFYFHPNDKIYFGGWNSTYITTDAVYRDPSAWYHIVLAVDTNQATATDRIKVYVNNVLQTYSQGAGFPGQSTDLGINQTYAHYIGGNDPQSGYASHMYADVFFIDGQQLTPSSFTETDATTGQLIPKAYTGSYNVGSGAVNGFHLEFADNSAATATTLGKDTSGNSPANNWTPNNLSVTAGAGNDSLVDVPSSSGTDTAVGGEVRGNYATLNPLTSGFAGTLSNGNLDYNLGSGVRRAEGTIAVTSGKWWWEALAVSGTTDGTVGGRFGFCLQSSRNDPEAVTFGLHWHATSGLATVINGSFTVRASGTNYGDGDVLGCALDADANIAYFYKNGTLAYTYNFSSHLAVGSGNLTPHAWNGSSGTPVWTYNFGQRAWTHTPRTNHKALCTTNLPAPLVTKPSTVMDVLTITGANQAYTGLNFSPDFLWFKRRDNIEYHYLFDTIRGGAGLLYSNRTDAEVTGTAYISAFGSNGFTTANGLLVNSASYVTWAWDAGSSTVTNTQGSISSQVRANASAGFSVVTYTGNGTGGATFGHGLGVAPKLVIFKCRTVGYDWLTYHGSLPNTTMMALNTTGGPHGSGRADFLNSTDPSSTVVTLGSTVGVNDSQPFVAYCFAPIVGYSSFGSYVGTGGGNPFVYLGFRPRWLMVKRSSTSGDNWWVIDSARNTYNVANSLLYPSDSAAETASNTVDFVSNGFVIRSGNSGYADTSGSTYIYAAFAESPFNYSRAR